MAFLSWAPGQIAGPSRVMSATRMLHTGKSVRAAAQRRTASTPKSQPAARHPSLRSPVSEAPASLPQQPDRPRTPPLGSAWPWRPTANPRTGAVEEERTLFARPFEMGRPRMYWFGALASGLFLTTWLLNPPPARSLPPAEGETQPREAPRDVFIHYASGAAVGTAAVVSLGFLALPSRYITRLSLVRSLGPNGGKKVFWRIKHAGQAMFSETSQRSKPRDLAIEDLNVKMLMGGGGRSPYLSLSITEPRKSWASLDAWPYRMDYRDSKLVKETDEEVVLSLNRIEHIFGRLDAEGKPLKAVLTNGE